MATGRLGTADLVAGVDTTLYTVPEATFTVCTVSLCNRSASATNVRLAVCDTATPGADEYVEYDVELVASGTLERTGLVLDAGKIIVVRSSNNNCTAMAYGIETTTA